MFGRAAASPNGEATDQWFPFIYRRDRERAGLKLEAHKRREPVLVIDHIEEKPKDN
jgi:uncharacterized protein (TIGR03435 family)